jgi:hypothetical protein
MDNNDTLSQASQLEMLSDIRQLMRQSSRFLSLSGLSGICAGICALLGAAAVPLYLGVNMLETWDLHPAMVLQYSQNPSALKLFLILDALCVLVAAFVFGLLFTWRKAIRKGYKMWDATSWKFAYNLTVPLAAGGAFCLLLLYHGIFGLIAPAMLIFYGVTLFNASKWTLDEVHYLGLSEIVLGLISAFYIGYGLLFWAIGFGVLHIAYGALMWWRHDR